MKKVDRWDAMVGCFFPKTTVQVRQVSMYVMAPGGVGGEHVHT